jgi:hypothetical protein
MVFIVATFDPTLWKFDTLQCRAQRFLDIFVKKIALKFFEANHLGGGNWIDNNVRVGRAMNANMLPVFNIDFKTFEISINSDKKLARTSQYFYMLTMSFHENLMFFVSFHENGFV